MSSLEQRTDFPVKPVYSQSRANAALEIETLDTIIRQGAHELSTRPTIRMEFVPKADLSFFVPPNDQDMFASFSRAWNAKNTEMELVGRGIKIPLYMRRFNSEIGTQFNPTTSRMTVTAPTKDIQYVTFHLFNFPRFLGIDDFILSYGPKFESFRRIGKVTLAVDDWKITITEVENAERLEDELESHGGYALIHVGRIERADQAAFSTAVVEDLMACLQYFLSFSSGRWAGASFPVGFNSQGERIFEEWGLPTCNSGDCSRGLTWFDTHHGESLTEVFPGFLKRWNSPLWKETITSSLYFYLAANERGTGIGIDTAIMLGQSALERLAWTYCVQDQKLVSASAFKPGKLGAADKLRILITSLGIPKEIPATMPSLAAMTPKPVDGPEAIVNIRNSVVHPDTKHQPSHEAIWNGWFLSQWYLDLIFLRLCNYNGDYSNRTVTPRGPGKVERVPWAT